MFATLTAAAALTAAQPPDRPTAAPAAINGSWTVVCLEKNGQPVADAKDMTVTVTDNTVTFKKRDGTTQMKAMRFEFGPNGTLRVSEPGDDGKFTAPPKISGATGTPGGAGTAGDAHGMKTGVYVLTHDYLAVCVHDQAAGGGRPGTAQPGGGTTTATQPPAGAGQPQQRSYCTVILRRAEGGRPAGGQ